MFFCYSVSFFRQSNKGRQMFFLLFCLIFSDKVTKETDVFLLLCLIFSDKVTKGDRCFSVTLSHFLDKVTKEDRCFFCYSVLFFQTK